MPDIRSETMALAALFQSCTQIQRLASTGYYDENAVAALIRANMVTKPDTIDDIYDIKKLRVGFSILCDCFGRSNSNREIGNIEVTRLAFKIMLLTSNLERSKRLYARLSDEIDALHDSILTACPDFLDGRPEVVNTQENLSLMGTLYHSIISPNFSKLLIYGEESVLRVPENQVKIRALLLSAVRAVILWRQVGGRRRFLMFRRKAIVRFASEHK
ncbi:MAG: lysogenization protein HflD [Succinivibrio sp.]